MREIGVRELRQSLAAVLDSVSRGEPVRITARGRAVADLVPVGAPPRNDGLRNLAEQGRLVLPARTRPRAAPRPVASERLASSVVLAERESGG